MAPTNQATTGLSQRIAGGQRIVLAEIQPPLGADPAAVTDAATRYAGKVHALGVNDNRDRVGMSALAAASLVAGAGLEPVLHLTTRDRNRVALVSDALGAQALGIRNVLCTSGTHQTLGRFRAAKNVFDIDTVQVLQAFAGLPNGCPLVGEEGAIAAAAPFCLGAVAADADPLELQVARLAKKVQAGATFLITQPVFDFDRFKTWWQEVTRRGLHEKAAIVAGIQPLTDDELEKLKANHRPRPRIADATIERVASKAEAAARRAAATELAYETVSRLGGLKGLRGFSFSADGDHELVLGIIAKCGLGN